MSISNGWGSSFWELNHARADDEGFQESRMREIRTSGSTRGQWAAGTVAHCPTLPAQGLFAARFLFDQIPGFVDESG